MQQHFIFRFEGRLLQFVRMPFGLASAPRVCTQLLSVVAHKMSVSGIGRLIRYLDDFLFLAHSAEAMQAILDTAQQLFSDFGLVVNTDKTEGPLQRIAFLGIQLDSIAQTLSCTPARVAELTSLLRIAYQGDAKLRLSFLATLIGKLQFASSVLPGRDHSCVVCWISSSVTAHGSTRSIRLPADGCTSLGATMLSIRTRASEPTFDSGSRISTSGTASPSGARLRPRHSA